MSIKPQTTGICLFPEYDIPGLEEYRRKYIFHSGRSIPLHVSLTYQFPYELQGDVIQRLKQIARATPRFEFRAIPVSSFPTTRVLYLTPSPVTPIETLCTMLHRAFPGCRNAESGFPVFHMTLALGYAQAEEAHIIAEYFSAFGKDSLALKAHRIGIYTQHKEEWLHSLSVRLGDGSLVNGGSDD